MSHKQKISTLIILGITILLVIQTLFISQQFQELVNDNSTSGILPDLQLNFSYIIWLIAGVFWLISVSLVIFAVNIYFKPLNDLGNTLEKIADGEYSFEIQDGFGGEIGRLVYIINELKDKLENRSQQIGQQGMDIGIMAQEFSSSLKEKAVELQSFSTSISEVLLSLESLARDSNNLKTGLETFQRNTHSTNDHAKTAFNNIEKTSSMITRIHDEYSKTISKINQLEEKGRRVQEILNQINILTDHTHYSAFQATVEASELGESGSRFDVVAREIQRLSGELNNEVNKMKDNLDFIHKHSQNLVLDSEDWVLELNEVSQLTRQVMKNVEKTIMKSDVNLENFIKLTEVTQNFYKEFDTTLKTLQDLEPGFKRLTLVINEDIEKGEDLTEQSHQLILNSGVTFEPNLDDKEVIDFDDLSEESAGTNNKEGE